MTIRRSACNGAGRFSVSAAASSWFSGILALASAAFGQAQTLSYTAFFGDALNQVPIANFPQSLSLPKFDSNLGTLTGVTLTLESTAYTVISKVINLTSADQPFTGASARLNLTLTGPGSVSTTLMPYAGTYNGVVTGPLFTVTIAGAASPS